MLGLDASARDRIQDQPARQQQETQQHQRHAQDRRGKPRHQPGLEIGFEQRNRQHDRQRGAKHKADGEEQQRPLGLEQLGDGGEDAPAIAPGIQFALRALRAHTVGGFDLGHRHAQLQCVHGQFGFGFESLRMRSEGFDVAPREHPIAGQHVVETASEQQPRAPRQQHVADAMTGPIRSLLLLAARADHHVQALVDQLAHQRRCGGRVVRGIAIDQHIDVRFHIGKSTPHHIALALQRHAAHLRACRCGDRRGGIAGIVVQHMDRRARQGSSKRSDHRGDRRRLVMAGHQHGDSDPGHRHGRDNSHGVGHCVI